MLVPYHIYLLYVLPQSLQLLDHSDPRGSLPCQTLGKSGLWGTRGIPSPPLGCIVGCQPVLRNWKGIVETDKKVRNTILAACIERV